MKKTAIAFLLLISLLPAWALAEKIEAALSPDLSGAPWCEGILWDMVLEEPQDFPFPIPCYQTEYAKVNVGHIRALLAQYGLPRPDKEKWYNGEDAVNRRNYVFAEMDHGRYQLYAYPWGVRTETAGHPQEEKLRAATEICRQFLCEAGISGIEEPYCVVQRYHEYGQGNSLGVNDPDENQAYLDEIRRVAGDRFTGIGFRYMLGGLPVATLALYDPTVADRKDSYFDSWGAMTVRDDGVITHFELRNYRRVARELEPYDGPVCSWQEAVQAVLRHLIGETEASFQLHNCEHLRITHTEPSLAISPGGTTFPVWAIVCEAQYRLDNGSAYCSSSVRYVDARTGKPAVPGENMTP